MENLENKELYIKRWNKSFIIRALITLVLFIIIAILGFLNRYIFNSFYKTAYIVVYSLGVLIWVLTFVFKLKLKLDEDDYEKIYIKEKKKNRDVVLSKNGKILYNILNGIDYYLIIELALCLALVIFTFFAFPGEVDQTSMQDTLYQGDRVFALRNKTAEKGDIVIFEYSSDIQANNNSLDGKLLIKRIIAGPGDTFKCVDGVIYVNGIALDEQYVSHNKINSFTLIDMVQRNSNSDEIINSMQGNYDVIPDGYYVLLGDNRAVSNDSEEFGLIYYKQFTGVVVLYKHDGWKKINNN